MARLLWLLLGAFLTGDAVFLVFCSNFDIGLFICFFLGILCLVYGFRYRRIREISQRGLLRAIRTLIYIGFGVLFLFFCFLAGYGNADNVTYREDVLILPGAAVHGEIPSLPLAQRLQKALEYHKKNPSAQILVSGGKGPQERLSEAEVMERYLLEHEVPQELILTENEAHSTFQNFKFASEILEKEFPNGYQAAFVSNDFHVYRATQLAKNAGLSVNHLHTETVWFTLPSHYFREVLAVLKLWILGI